MGLLHLIGLGDKRKICAGCNELSVLRVRVHVNPMHPTSKRYWGCPYGPALYCCKPENVGKKLEINFFGPKQKRWG